MVDAAARRLDVLLYKRLAARKLASFRAFAELYPEYCWCFCGDNGQAGAHHCSPLSPAEGCLSDRVPAACCCMLLRSQEPPTW